MSDELESRLPEGKYIKIWKKKVKKSKTTIQLTIKMPYSKWEYRKPQKLQGLLKEHQIPIDYQLTSWWNFVRYSGNSEETGKYEITSGSSSWNSVDVITLDIKKKSEGLGRIPELITVMKKYVDLYKD